MQQQQLFIVGMTGNGNINLLNFNAPAIYSLQCACRRVTKLLAARFELLQWQLEVATCSNRVEVALVARGAGQQQNNEKKNAHT